MESHPLNNDPKVVKEIDCFVTSDISKKLLILRHKNRIPSRPLEFESIKNSRIKATFDHLEITIGDGRLDTLKTSAEKKDAYTLRSVPEKKSPVLLGYFVNGECHFVLHQNEDLIMDNIKEPIKISELLENPNEVSQPSTSSATVVSARIRTEAEMFGAKRLASRRKTAENDSDLRYLSQLHLTPWRLSHFKPHRSVYAYEDRMCLMCSSENVSHDAHEFTQEFWESKLLAPLREDASDAPPLEDDQVKNKSLEEIVRNILVKVQIIKFEKLLDCLRGRASDRIQVTPKNVIACLNKCAVLLKGWWAVRSEILYPPNFFSEHAAVPSPQLIRARDYIMAVFHKDGHLTRKTVSSVTKLPSLEVTEILETLGHRIYSGTEGHNNHWEFRRPDVDFIRSHPDVVYQHNESWDLRIRQLCSQLKLDVLVSDSVPRRRRCSGRFSSSDTDDLFISPSTSPRGRRRCRLLSLSPDQSHNSLSSLMRSPPAKRARTMSASESGDQPSNLSSIALPPPPPPAASSSSTDCAVESSRIMCQPPPLTPLHTNGGISPRKSPARSVTPSNATASPTPPPPPPQRSVTSSPQSTAAQRAHPPSASSSSSAAAIISMASAMQAVNSSLSIRVASDPKGDLLKQEPRSPASLQPMETEPSPPIPPQHTSSGTPAPAIQSKVEEPEYSMTDDPEIRTFVKEKLRTLPILALSELTKACQPFLASLGTNPLVRAGTAPPPGSEAERTMLSSELYKVVTAVGGRELKVDWPKVSWALPKQPLFVAPMVDDFGDISSPYIQVREAILERLEGNQFVTFGYIKQKLLEKGVKITDNNLRTTIKRYCIYRQSKYFLRYTVDERP